MQIFPNPKAHFQVVSVCFVQVPWKLEFFQICSFNRKTIISTSIRHQFQLVPKFNFSLIPSSSEHLQTCKERKRSINLVNFQLISKHCNLIGQGLAVTNFKSKMQEEFLLFNLFFTQYYFLWHCIFYKKFGWDLFPRLAIRLHTKNRRYMWSGNIWDLRILQSNWFKTFPIIIQ